LSPHDRIEQAALPDQFRQIGHRQTGVILARWGSRRLARWSRRLSYPARPLQLLLLPALLLAAPEEKPLDFAAAAPP
jgi:hypothetical protein